MRILPAMLRFALLLTLLAGAGCDRGPKSEAATPSQPAVASKPTESTAKTFGAGVTVAETTSIDKILAEVKFIQLVHTTAEERLTGYDGL